MLKVIVGEKGAGKTKALLESVNQAVENEHGSVVFINNGNRHIYDLSYRVRLVDTSEFSINSYSEFYGILCGIISQNFDITSVFVDSLTKIADGTKEEMEEFLEKTNALCEKYSINLMVTVSVSADSISDKIKEYVA